MRRRGILIAAGGCLAALAGFFLLLEPALADAQIAGDNRALGQAAAHQAEVDAALQQFLIRGSSGADVSDDHLLTQSSANLAQYEAARKLVTQDRAALQGALQPEWLVAAALGKSDALHTARLRTTTAVNALAHANQVLSAAIDQERLQQGFFFTAVTETKMLNAINDQQYVQIDAYYVQADRALRVAESLMNRPDESPGFKPVVVAMRSVIDQTQKYGAALLRNDMTAASARHAAMRAGYAALAAATSASSVTANDDWNDLTYQPLIAAYHAGLAATLS
jgi:hypothetical protein